MKNLLKKWIALFLALSMIVMLPGCGSSQAKAEEENNLEAQKQVEVIKLAGGDWGYPTPYGIYPRGPGSRKMALIFDALVTTDVDGNIIPRLATEWQASEDGLVYTLKLRPDVKWNDGEALTAEDVVFSYDYQKTYIPVNAVDFSKVVSMEATESQTVNITITEPDPKFMSTLTSFNIIPKHVWETVIDPNNYQDAKAVVGTGPYKLTDYSKEHGTYRFEINEEFWGNEPKVKEIKFIPVSEEILAFEQGEVDRISITPDVLDRFESNDEYEVMQYVTSWAYRLYYNMNNESDFANVTFRQALAYAINRDQLVEKIERGAAVPGNPGVLHPTNKLYNGAVEQYANDPQKAEELLDSIGFKDTDGDKIRENDSGEKLSFTLLADEGSTRLAELIKQDLALVGVEVNVQTTDTKSRDARFAAGDFEMVINGSGGGEDLSEVTNVKKSAKATSTTAEVIGYNNPEVDRLYTAQLKATGPEEQLKLSGELQNLVAQELPKLTLYYTNTIAVHRPKVYNGWSADTYHNDARINFVAD
ncbi:ABC transporter substrate-binding protein [Acetobacterium woodii]|uniref:Gluthation ABC transport system substrate binding protein GsiB n=1 Tax=Acetobacterium woodii (strain ATCC 29683 / DSM 1030 / JCM 2381 / KCTC 1655 / WB1) TaxID=931626 RepID=H6LIB7_ACEWD|nr:ABC transporter substrate-binding protein [Acetobacterium woodii]AFA47291.1 gluthation ABC transport system substrate binding protein GsiB [Acetobacterium woodii DSM 1030]